MVREAEKRGESGLVEIAAWRRLSLRRLPAMDEILNAAALADILELYGRDAARVQARQALDEVRREIRQIDIHCASDREAWLEQRLASLPSSIAAAVVETFGPGLRRVINATGILVHTNLGRSPLPIEVATDLAPLLAGYCDLEIDLGSGRRSDRNRHVVPLLRALCGAESALVTNNNAGALVLVLATLARGREVVVSRGELVEIGGSFRIPEILEAAGCSLREVGTTNRTRLEDYRRAIGEDTGLLLKVHPSNYRIRGFTAEVSARELVALGREHDLPVVVDEGSGLTEPSDRPPLRDHQDLRSLLAAGCDLVCGSGDKVLGGPQAGLLLGRRDLVERCRRHALYRALRPDRFTFAALEAILRRHLRSADRHLDRLWPDPDGHARRLEKLAERLRAVLGSRVEITLVEASAFVGGGSAPDAAIPGQALALGLGALGLGDEVAAELRSGDGRPGRASIPPVVGYQRDDRLVLDLRTVCPEDDDLLADAVLRAVQAFDGR